MGFNNSNTEIIEQHYQGFCSTPNLWFADTVLGLNQFENENDSNALQIDAQNLPKRLGKRVEHFVFNNLKQNPNITVLAENLQIQHYNQTIGELDALIVKKQQAIHLEIVYKFYLYDPLVGTTALDRWIGPNRNDSLVKKLNKLKNNQLPLLFRPETRQYLQELGLRLSEIEQQVLFKAQLFLPLGTKTPDIHCLNINCIAGSYINFQALPSLSNCKFYLPPKLDWLVQTNQDVNWLSYKNILELLHNFLTNKQSPLVWIKHPDNTLERCFIVWW